MKAPGICWVGLALALGHYAKPSNHDWPNGQQSQQQMDHTFLLVSTTYIYLYNTWHTAPLLLGNVVATRDYIMVRALPELCLRHHHEHLRMAKPQSELFHLLTDNFLDLAASVQVKRRRWHAAGLTTYGYDEVFDISIAVVRHHHAA